MDYSVFSKYRTELMGIAILNVMALHALSWTQAIEHPNMVVLALNTFGRLIFTEGFLFFSGLGIYYSLTNNSNIRDFYERRMKRLMVPYIIIASPFFLYQWVSGKFEIDILLLKLSSLFFWIQGNDGMWYISLSLVLYMFSPLIYKALSFSGGGEFMHTIICYWNLSYMALYKQLL